MENDGPESYWIKLDGSGRLSKRKRQHIKKIKPFLVQMKKSLNRNSQENANESSRMLLRSDRQRDLSERGGGDNRVS